MFHRFVPPLLILQQRRQADCSVFLQRIFRQHCPEHGFGGVFVAFGQVDIGLPDFP